MPYRPPLAASCLPPSQRPLIAVGGLVLLLATGCGPAEPAETGPTPPFQTTGGPALGTTTTEGSGDTPGSSTSTSSSPGWSTGAAGGPFTTGGAPGSTSGPGSAATDAGPLDADTTDAGNQEAAPEDAATSPAPSGDAAQAADADSGSPGPEAHPTVWIAGDSTVANGLTPCPRGWGAEIGALFDDRVTVENRAVGGRSVRTWMYVTTDAMRDGECVRETDSSGAPALEQRWAQMLDGMAAGDFLLVQFGINDGSPTCPRHVGSAAFKQHYGELASAAQARGVQPIFLTPVSMIKCSGSRAVGSRGFLTETHEVAETHGVPVIDLHARSVELYDALQFCPVPGGDVSASTRGAVGDFFCDDHTHFAEPGAKQIAQLVAEALVEQGLPLGAFLADGDASSASTTPTTLYIAGDSTVSSYADTARDDDQAGWGQMLHEHFGSLVSIENHAIGGRTARRFIDEGRLDAIASEIGAGDYLLVQFGTNDSHRTATYTIDGKTVPYYLDPATDFKTYLRRYVEVAEARGATPVFVTPPPRNSAYCTGGNGLAAHSQAMRELAAAEDVALADLNQKTVAHLQSICPAPTPENFFLVRPDGSVDGTHFQEHGARVLSGFVADGIVEAGLAVGAQRR